MKNIFNKKTSFIALFMTMSICNISFGYGPIAHYLLTRDCKDNTNDDGTKKGYENYANLPDLWDSSEMDYSAWNMGTGKYFRWSHGLIDQGYYDITLEGTQFSGFITGIGASTLNVPKEPLLPNPDDGRSPGKVMDILIEKKLDTGSGRWGDVNILKKTKEGFNIHNAQDKEVHYGYFLAAQENFSNIKKQEAWVIHHGLKETWFEYRILEQKFPEYFSTTRNKIIDPPYGYNYNKAVKIDRVELSKIIDFGAQEISNKERNKKTIAGLIHVSQAVFFKNRTRHTTYGTDDKRWLFDVKTIDNVINDINNWYSNGEDHFGDYFNKNTWAKWEKWNINLVYDRPFFNEETKQTETIDFDSPKTLEEEYNLLEKLRTILFSEYIGQNDESNIIFTWTNETLYM